MSTLTRALIVLIAVAIPVTTASAGKYGRPRVDPGATTVATAPPNRTPAVIDETAVEMLRNADREDLSEGQMKLLEKEVVRLNQLEAKSGSDGEISDRDAQRLYESAVLSCQKIMTPGEVRRTGRSVGTNRSAEARETKARHTR